MNTRQNPPTPKMPQIKKVTSVEELLPMARKMVSRKVSRMYEGIEINEGQRVLIINDFTADQLVVEALAIAIRERGAHVDIISLEGFPGLKDPVDLVDTMFSNNWYPDWAWAAANEADVVILTAFLKAPHTPTPALSNNPAVENFEITSDLMISEYETFPVELRDTIGHVAWEQYAHCSHVRWTDLEGTDLTLDIRPEDWETLIKRDTPKFGIPYMTGHLKLPTPCEGMNGIFVTSSITFAGPVPRTTLVIEGGKVVEVKGGGHFGDRLRESFEQYKDLTSKKCPGPGVNWITTVGICTHPKASPSPFYDELAGSARVYAWLFGHRRSGVIHSSVGEGMASSHYKIIRHMDTYFNTIVTEKGTLIENGHLTALDDPRVREVAAKYGDPDKLLEESWVPAVSGINAP